MSFLEEYRKWNEVTGVPEKGTGWDLELQSIFEDADKEVARLRGALDYIGGLGPGCDLEARTHALETLETASPDQP